MYCKYHQFDPYEPSVRHVTDFLRLLLEDGASYSTINIARCALSAVIDTGSKDTIGSDPMVALVVKGCGNVNPPEPKYDSIWDVSVVFKLLEKWGHNRKLSILQLSKKLTMLLLLCTAQRGQTVWRFTLSGLKFTDDGARFHMRHQLKHNRPGEPLSSIKVVAFPDNKNICPISCLKEYLYRTKKLRGKTDQLLITTSKPYEGVARGTVSSWAKKLLREAGVDTKRFASHSTRAAATSAAISSGININTLLNQASWKSSETFAKHYNKPIEEVSNSLTHKISRRFQKEN